MRARLAAYQTLRSQPGEIAPPRQLDGLFQLGKRLVEEIGSLNPADVAIAIGDSPQDLLFKAMSCSQLVWSSPAVKCRISMYPSEHPLLPQFPSNLAIRPQTRRQFNRSLQRQGVFQLFMPLHQGALFLPR